MKRRYSLSKLKTFLLSCLAGLILLGGFWSYDTNKDPQIVIPAPAPVPTPNGFDYFVQATKYLVPEPQSLIEAAYAPGAEELHPNPAHNEHFAQKYPLKDRATWLEQNQQSLALLRQGLAYPCRYPPRAQWQRPVSRFYRLGDLFIEESRVNAARGDWKSAAQSALDEIRFGHACSNRGVLLSWLSGKSISSRGLNALSDVVEGLDAPMARNIARQLQDSDTHFPTVADALQEEKWMTLIWYRDTLRRSDWRKVFADIIAQSNATAFKLMELMPGPQPSKADYAEAVAEYYKTRAKMLTFSKRRLVANYTAVADAAITAARQPYKQIKQARGRDIFSDVYVDMYDRMHFYEAKVRTRSTLLQVALALRAYKLEHHGAYPPTLENLAPSYLPTIPSDAFNSNKPLRYQLKGKTYKLWSVGPDGQDNNGQVALNSSSIKKYQTGVELDSKGDYVYGVNH
jgi:hypothetical protein